MAKTDEDSLSGSESGSSSNGDEETGLTTNQNRLLYLISLYTKSGPDPDAAAAWLLKPALLVLIFEGIVAGVLDFDYAPASVSVEHRRVWMNVSQEGKSDVEFLREEQLVHALQRASRSVQPETSYRVSAKGAELLRRVARRDKDAVHEFAYAQGTRALLQVEWSGSQYFLVAGSYRRASTITETEKVSYVSSAYIPQCLRYGGRPTLSNAHRAHECAGLGSAVAGQHALDEVITLNSVSVIVAEYVPFGANQLVQLNSNLGSTERVQGGFIAPASDERQMQSEETSSGLGRATVVHMSPELTSVDILDYTLTNHINFEAEINADSGANIDSKSEDDVVRVKTFGVSLNAEGTCFYGLQVEAVLDRVKDNISLDHLSRLLIDVQGDSSSIVDALISQYQRDLLQLVFLGDSHNRNKVNLIIANEITPHLTAEEYMDKGEYEDELKQVIGDTKAAYDISEHDTLVFGSHGLLVAGPNSRHHEPLLCAYLQFITIDIFIQNFFTRIWVLNDDMATTNRIIEEGNKDPTSLARIRYRVCKLSKDLILLEEVLGFILEALEIIEVPPEPPEQAGRSLYERLEISSMRNQLIRRAMDLKKNMIGLQKFLNNLREMSAGVSELKLFGLNESVDLNTKRMCLLQDSNERTAGSMQVLQILFGGILAFNILDRITGNNWSVADSPWFSDIYSSLIVDAPMAWFGISIAVWIIACLIIYWYHQNNNYLKQGMTTIRIKINKRIFITRLRDFLLTKQYSTEERQYDDNADIVRITYTEQKRKEWGGETPIITLEFDERNYYLLSISVLYNRRKASKVAAFTADELKRKIMKDLSSMNVWDAKGEDRSMDDLAADKRALMDVVEMKDKNDETNFDSVHLSLANKLKN